MRNVPPNVPQRFWKWRFWKLTDGLAQPYPAFSSMAEVLLKAAEGCPT